MKTLSMKLRNLRRRRGQGMTEYIIIVGLIAILLISAVELFKNKLEETYSKSTKAIDDHVTKKIQ
ncbi:MAG: Flp family type IVb pilin [Planctomycetota bacterium]|jgi:pilus assembly protein Flp/PilA